MAYRCPIALGLVIVAVGSMACQQRADRASDTACRADPEVAAKIASAFQVHVAGHLKGDPVTAASIYTDDVWFRWEGNLDLQGRAKAEEAYRGWYAAFRIVDMGYTSDEVLVCGDAAHEVGHYYMTTDAKGKRETSREHYMALWRRQADGSWKMARAAGSALKESK